MKRPTNNLDDELRQAQYELAALEQAVEELPGTLEAKFQQELHHLASHIGALQINQLQLQQQLSNALPATKPANQAWRAAFARLSLAAVLTGSLVALGWGAIQLASKPNQQGQARSRPSADTSIKPTLGTLTIRTSGPSWVEVRDLLSNKTLLIDVLQPEKPVVIGLRSGLRLRSGRADLLTLQVDQGPQRSVAQDIGLGWFIIRPPGSPRSGTDQLKKEAVQTP